MHIIIGFLTALASLLYALERLGIDLGWLNPWAWKRRRAWLKKSTGNPAFGLDKPIDAIALVAIAAVKIDGDLSIEEKIELKKIFITTFKQSERESSQLFNASIFLLGSGEEVFKAPEKVLRGSIGKFTVEQKASSIELLSRIINIDGNPSEIQQEFFTKVRNAMYSNDGGNGW